MEPRRVGQLYEWSDYDGEIVEECDVLIVGSGPGGALAAYELAKAGKRVIVLEAGPKVRHGDTRRDAGQVLSRYFFYGGMRSTRGNTVMPSMQPRNLGGGSVWNSAICLRSPQFALERWESDHGLRGVSAGALDRHYEAVEQFMGVRPVADEVMGPRNELFREACENLGFTASRIARNEEGCQGSAECFTQCPNDAKFSMDRRGIPEVLALGGTVYTCAPVHELVREGSRVAGVRGHLVHPTTRQKSHRFEIRAQVTILAAGCLATPELMQRSGVGNSAVGQNLRFHPGTMVMGFFNDRMIEPWSGATQGYHCLDFLPEGIKLEALWATSSLMASRCPGLGAEYQDLLSKYRSLCSWDSWVSGEDSVGYVKRRVGRRADIVYNIGQGDVDRAAESMAKLCDMFFSVGADYVMCGVNKVPKKASDPKVSELIRNTQFTIQDLPLASNHIFGTTAMGSDPSRHVTDESGAVYGVDDLYICDTGLLPATPAANPMLPMMALVHRNCEAIASRY